MLPVLGSVNLLKPVLWNRNYILRFRFRLLKSYGSGSGSGSSSYLRKVTVPVPAVPVPVLAPYLDHKKQILKKKFWKIYCLFTQ
jgi:hypothetical protein